MFHFSSWRAGLARLLPVCVLSLLGPQGVQASGQLIVNTGVVSVDHQDIQRDVRTLDDVQGRQRLDASVTSGAAERIEGQAIADLDVQQGGIKLLSSVQSTLPSGERLRGESVALASLSDTLRLSGTSGQPARLRLQVGYDATQDLSPVVSADVVPYVLLKESTTDFQIRVSWEVPNPRYGAPGASLEESPSLTEQRVLTGHMWTFWNGRDHWYSAGLTELDVHGDLSTDERPIYLDEPPAGSLPDAHWQGSHAFDVWVPADTDLEFEWLASVHSACADTRLCSAQVDAMHSFSLALEPSAGEVTSASGYAFLQQSAPVPEPGAPWMALVGLGALGGIRHVRQVIRRAV